MTEEYLEKVKEQIKEDPEEKNNIQEFRPTRKRDRILAIIVDTIVLMAVGMILDIFFSDLFFKLSYKSYYIGFIIFVLYYSICESYIGKGQTLGKKATKIKLVDMNGKYLYYQRALSRVLIYIIPTSILWFLYPFMSKTLDIYTYIGNTNPINVFTIFTFLSGSFYLMNFLLFFLNKTTRQLVHDYFTGSVLVDQSYEGEINKRSRYDLKKYFIPAYVSIFLILFSINYSITTFVVEKFQDENFFSFKTSSNEINILKDELKKIKDVKNVIIHDFGNFPGQKTDNKGKFLQLIITFEIFPEDKNQIDEKVSNILRLYYKDFDKLEKVQRVYNASYNLMIYSRSKGDFGMLSFNEDKEEVETEN